VHSFLAPLITSSHLVAVFRLMPVMALHAALFALTFAVHLGLKVSF
jgi:hypothetical protein